MQPTFIPMQNLDFNAYKNSLKEYLRSQELFRDYDFEGSNLSVLLDLLTHNTYMNAFYLNMVGSEMFLDSAQLHESVVSHAKELNYVPGSRTSAMAKVTLKFSPPADVTTISIPSGTRIDGRLADGALASFVTEEPYIANRRNAFTVSGVSVYEGSVVKEAFLVQPNRRYILQDKNVDIRSIKVRVQNSKSDTRTVEWSRATSIYGIANDEKVFFVQAAADGKYEIYFGDDIISAGLKNGNIVLVEYRHVRYAEAANGAKVFSTPATIGGYIPQIILEAAASGGSDRESIESIRFKAPKFFATQERAVTAADFESIVTANFNSIQSVSAYGGEKVEPKQYGKVFLSIKPKNGEFLSDVEKGEIESFLRKRCSLSIDPVVVDPSYLYLALDVNIKYNTLLTSQTPNEIRLAVRDAILEYNLTQLSDFGKDLRKSKLLASIDAAENAIISSQALVLLSRRERISPGQSQVFVIDFTQPLRNIYTTPTLSNPTFYSDTFIVVNQSSQFEARLQDNGIGEVVLVTGSGETTKIVKGRMGSVDYKTGTVKINSIVIGGFENNQIKFYARPENEDVEIDTNTILVIDEEDLTIQVSGI